MFKLKRSCREVTWIVLQGEDRAWTLGERLVLHLHWRACGACFAFRRQAVFMRQALGQWKNYRDEA
jgi:hypothetical protein